MLEKLIRGTKVTRADIENALFEMCDDNHGCNCESCLVYKYNGGEAPHYQENQHDCNCFKNGKAMYKFLAEKMEQRDKCNQVISNTCRDLRKKLKT